MRRRESHVILRREEPHDQTPLFMETLQKSSLIKNVTELISKTISE